jgi:hypothetical protein
MKKAFFLLALLGIQFMVQAYNFPFLKFANTNRPGKTYLTSDDDGIIFSWTQGAGYTSNIRFSMIVNTGFKYNYNFTKNVAIYSGFSLKNVGMADRFGDSVIRKRNYYAGIPIGLRLGNLKSRSEINIGGGVDFTIHHKEKFWTEGSKKSTKQKENFAWFDNKYSPFVNPYVFGAFKLGGYGLKYQYYLQPFLKGGNTNLMYISLLMDASNKSSFGRPNKKTKKIKKSINSI